MGPGNLFFLGQSLHFVLSEQFFQDHALKIVEVCPRNLAPPHSVHCWPVSLTPAVGELHPVNVQALRLAKHKEFTVPTDVQVYFCDPQSPWQRGTNENTNLLLRQYFPRETDLSPITQAQLDQVSLRLNQRPRKTLGFQTPADKLQASVASTV